MKEIKQLYPQKHIYPLTILESHLDYFGHVNHAVYLILLEEARWDMITSRGFGLYELQTAGYGPIVLEVHLKFRKELKLRKKVFIETEVVSYQRKIATLKQEIKDESGKIYCTAFLKNGLLDLKERRLINPTPEWLRALGVAPAVETESIK